MQYRRLGNTGFNGSVLGFGAMRLPTKDGKRTSGNIDVDLAAQMIRRAIDEGVNYVDTAFFYHQGNSESAVGIALKDGYRQKVRLATKSPVMLMKEEADFDKYLNIQLERLQTDFIDMYLIHGINGITWKNIVKSFGLLEKAEKAKKDGKIGHIGFSFHDKYDVFKKVIDEYDGWEFCQIQLNYLDDEFQAGVKGLKYAAEKGLGVIVMEPLRGGSLANLSEEIIDTFDASAKKRTPVQWALDWVWNFPEVSIALSGMSDMEQVVQNIGYAEQTAPFSADDCAIIKNVKQKIKEMTAIPCTNCGYCMPCPSGVAISQNFKVYNESFMFSDENFIKTSLGMMRAFHQGSAYDCVNCGECEKKCPQQIQISKHMNELKDYFTKKGWKQ